MADSFGEKGISKNYPVSSDTGVDADQYHEGRKIFLEAEGINGTTSIVKQKVKDTL